MPTRTEEGLITLTGEEILHFAKDCLLKHVHLYINGTKCTLENVYELILKASAGQTSVNDVCDDTPGGPTGTAVLNQLHQALPQDIKQVWRLEAKELISGRRVVAVGVLYYGTVDLSAVGNERMVRAAAGGAPATNSSTAKVP